MTTKCTKWPLNMPSGRKIDKMAINKMATITIARPSKIYPNWDFWFEHKPSGNPDFKILKEKQSTYFVGILLHSPENFPLLAYPS
jgi:hypothetical protein